jgi:tol-pal system protein YbgF
VRIPSPSIVLACVLGTGCASQLSQLKQANREMADRIGTLRAQRRADESTIRDLQNQIFVLKDRLETAQVAGGKVPGAVPKLPVEVLAPAPGERATSGDPDASDVSDLGGDARVVGVADDGTQIVYVGDAAAGKAIAPPPSSDDADDEGSARPRPRADRAPLPPVPTTTDRITPQRDVPKVSAVAARAPAPASRPGHADARDHDPVAEYQAAVDALKAGDYAEAISMLREFIRRYPDHDYADNAQYWLGEAYYAQKDYKRALEEFRATVERYPRGNKVPDALLKVGYCYAALGQIADARATLEQLISVYPRSRSAQLATTRLDTLGK